jgi:hypothetical protein
MNRDYQRYIVSTDENCTFLHRCSRDNLKDIFRSGIVCGSDPLSTMTWQPRILGEAEGIYRNGQAHGACAVVVQIPREIWETVHRKSPREEALDEKIGYDNEQKGDFAVKREFVVG